MKLVGKIVAFVGLTAKLYSYKMLDGFEDTKCKGVTKNLTKRSFQFDDYRECLFSGKEQHRKKWMLYEEIVMRFIQKKLIKSSDDNKRVIMADGIHTLAYAHTNFKKIIFK